MREFIYDTLPALVMAIIVGILIAIGLTFIMSIVYQCREVTYHSYEYINGQYTPTIETKTKCF